MTITFVFGNFTATAYAVKQTAVTKAIFPKFTAYRARAVTKIIAELPKFTADRTEPVGIATTDTVIFGGFPTATHAIEHTTIAKTFFPKATAYGARAITEIITDFIKNTTDRAKPVIICITR